MEVHCPKCHFVQPKDQYCARCGVDMQKYKPQSPSIFQKIKLHTSILFLIAMVILGLTVFIFRQNDRPLINSGNQFSAGKSFRTAEKNGNSQTATEAALTNEPAPEELELDKPESVDLKVADDVQLDQLSGGSQNRAQSAGTADFTNPRIKISFVEISQDQINSLLNESTNHSLLQKEADGFKGILPNISSLAQYNYKTLKQEVKEFRPNQIEAFFFGKSSAETSQFIGLQINLERKSVNGTTSTAEKWALTVNISRLESKEIDIVDFTMNKNAAFFMNAKNWLSGFESERSLFDTQPFSTLLSSSDFLNQKSEIIFILELY